MEPAASEAPDLNVGGKPNWLWIGGLLTGLFAMHLAVDAFLWPICIPPGPIQGLELMLFFGTMGITLVQPSLMAIAAVFAPARWTVRFTVSSALVVLLGYATLWGVAYNYHRIQSYEAIVLFGWSLGFLLFQIPLWVFRWFGRWRIVLPHSVMPAQAPRMGVSLRGMMLAVTVACVLAAIGRYSMRPVVWSEATNNWLGVATETMAVATLSTSGCLTIIPFIGMVLAVSDRRWYRLASFVGGMTAEAIWLAAVSYNNRSVPTTEDILASTSLLAGGYFSALISLLVVRACGFRLVREPVTRQLTNEHAAPAIIVASVN